ncbi:MAG: malate synthase A, partial [Mycobacteriaceae bacterium]
GGMATTGQVHLQGPVEGRAAEVLTPEALDFVARLQREFGERRLELLRARDERQVRLDAGELPRFLTTTSSVRDSEWKVAKAPKDLQDRRAEITGPTDAKMTINALNSGAKVWLADFEDANTPLWENMVSGQLNLRAALDRTIDFTVEGGKSYALKPAAELSTIVVRPRGWHLPEKHVLVDGEEVSGSLFDFTMYLVHCGQRQIDAGKGPYFYLPKMESHLEARLWNEVFVHAQGALGIPQGTIRATVLIETFPAAFEMEEILYELREHSSGCNAGRWDYLFSVIKCFGRRGKDFVLPDRNSVTMTAPFMRAYTELLVSTCHRRGAHAIGGMAAFIPSRKDEEVNANATKKVTEDKTREASDGFDGSWVAHPDMVGLCTEVFTKVLGERPNQLDKARDDVHVTAEQLLDIKSTPGEATEAGLRNAVSVGIQYLSAWLRGQGAVAIFNLMEDAATAEISRTQVWQWLHNDVQLSDGQTVTPGLVEKVVDEELAKIKNTVGEQAYADGGYEQGRSLFTEVALGADLSEFLTLPAYARMP